MSAASACCTQRLYAASRMVHEPVVHCMAACNVLRCMCDAWDRSPGVRLPRLAMSGRPPRLGPESHWAVSPKIVPSKSYSLPVTDPHGYDASGRGLWGLPTDMPRLRAPRFEGCTRTPRSPDLKTHTPQSSHVRPRRASRRTSGAHVVDTVPSPYEP